jgi:riboflavin synthase
VDDRDGSWSVWFRFAEPRLHVMVPKGSVTVSGVSLTVVEVCDRGFSVAIIPYTWQHTNFHTFAPGTVVNIEFDVIGKYVERMMAGWQEARGARS